jgi:hypothetical protein
MGRFSLRRFHHSRVLEQTAETRGFGVQKCAEFYRIHVKDFDSLLSKVIAHLWAS